jgi:hypothetical protein
MKLKKSTQSIVFCPTGMYVYRHCTEFTSTSCASCTEGTFQDGDNGREQCFSCKHCDPGKFSYFSLLFHKPLDNVTNIRVQDPGGSVIRCLSFKTLSPLKQEHELNYVK